MKNYNQDIGQWLADRRRRKGLTQEDVAGRMGITKVAIHYYETGKRRIDADTMIQYCLVIGEDPQDLVKDVMSDARL